jgi:Ala-tRNA(Pro) deacylase
MIPVSIADYLNRNHAKYSALPHLAAYTAQEEAAASHVPGDEWAKAVVCIADERPILAVVPAPASVDLERLRRVLDAREVRLAREPEFAGLYKDCELGAMPPFGPLYGQPVFVDRTLRVDGEIAFNAGSHHDAIRMPYREFERLVHPAVAEFARRPSSASAANTSTCTDPVCGAQILESRAAGRSVHRGETYYFCSESCQMEFADNPDAYRRT